MFIIRKLKAYLARKLAIGGTARLYGKYYLWFRKLREFKLCEDKVIFKEILEDRFDGNNLIIVLKKLDSGEIKGVKDLVIETLAIEASYYENTESDIKMFDKIIEEELIKKGVPKSAI